MKRAIAFAILFGCVIFIIGCEQLEDLVPCPDCPSCPECPSCPSCPECPPCECQKEEFLLTPAPKEQFLVDLINEYREEQGSGRLEWNAKLYTAAVLHAQAWAQACRAKESCNDQCWRNHKCPYELSQLERLQLAGYRGGAEEILAGGDGFYSSQDALWDWTDSQLYPGHYSIIRNGVYQEIGCSFVRCHKCWLHTLYVCLLGTGEGGG